MIDAVVDKICVSLGFNEATVSQCDLVVREQQGWFLYYEHADVRIVQLLDLADELLADVAKGVRQCSHYGSSPVNKLNQCLSN